ncbi:MAG: DUF4113 domain-containing protein [Sphaerochaetaceae bacterium]|jgi:DNA polymerase V|nr:DUF4113 domain-containing protein [Sphaerochaetaceae bacterium]NLY06858.1 Y-family DNA polymerase [Spirochaetales bacterium]
MMGLADCNSFYASCEKLFRPDLRDKPVVVLSNNDGCIVALTSEAKALGFERGATYAECRAQLETSGVTVFSSNYALYQDISDRTMNILRHFALHVEPYSIDESFFTVPVKMDYPDYAMRLHNTLKRMTGLMISVGVARTKTLAKIANHIAKKNGGAHCILPETESEVLKNTPIGDVWGVGHRLNKTMLHCGISTAWDLTQRSDAWIRRMFSVTGLRTACELRGQICIDEENPVRQSFTSGISFEKKISTIDDLECTISCHCEVLSRKLVNRGLAASFISVQILTDRFKDDFYFGNSSRALEQPASYAPALFRSAKAVLLTIFREGLEYKTSRVSVFGLSKLACRQFSLFDSQNEVSRLEKEDRFARFSVCQPELTCLSSGLLRKGNLLRHCHLSPHYTTRWSELPSVW